jgi:hypothetical protein
MNCRSIALLLIFTFIIVSCQKESVSNNDDVDLLEESISSGNTITSGVSEAAQPCVNGFSGKYPCKGYDLLGHINISSFYASDGNDSWGWTVCVNGVG